MAYNDAVIQQLQERLNGIDERGYTTNCALIFAYNGTGKTRLSRDFAHYGRSEDDEKHTLYYNAFTEDLFAWDNDLENDAEPKMRITTDSALIQGLPGGAIEEPVNTLLTPFTDIKARFHYNDETGCPEFITFSRTVKRTVLDDEGNEIDREDVADNIKISRGEERLFVWCFFRFIMDLAVAGHEAYKWVKYIYIDDPISSLDDNNIIIFAQQLYKVINEEQKKAVEALKSGEEVRQIKFVISTHHALFYHVMVHGLSYNKMMGRYFLYRDRDENTPLLKDMGASDTPFFYNTAMMYELQRAIRDDKLYPYHFTILRSIIEKIMEFFGHKDYRLILNGIRFKNEVLDNEDSVELFSRITNVLTHQGAMFQPKEMEPDNKEMIKALFYHLKKKYDFNIPDLADERSEKDIKANKKHHKTIV